MLKDRQKYYRKLNCGLCSLDLYIFADVLLLRYIYVFLIGSSILAYSGGISISKHYCAGDLVSKSINVTNDACSDMNTPLNKEGYNKVSCCLDEFHFYQASEYDHLTKDIASVAVLNKDFDTYVDKKITNSRTRFALLAKPPPDLPIYLKVRHLLIWFQASALFQCCNFLSPTYSLIKPTGFKTFNHEKFYHY